MTVTATAYRLTIPMDGSTFVPGQDSDPASTDFWVTSLRDPTKQNYITAPPDIEGDYLDLTSGTVRDGQFQVRVSDVGTTAANRYLTTFLADTDGFWQLSGRPAYLDISTNAGATWTAKAVGYVEGQVLQIAQEWIISVGNSRRTERDAKLMEDFDGMLAGRTSAFRSTALFGGPVLWGFPPRLPDCGFPLAQVLSNNDSGIRSWVSFGQWIQPLPPIFNGLRPPGGYGKVAPTLDQPRPGPGGLSVEDTSFEIALNAMVAPFFRPVHEAILNHSAPSGPVLGRGYYDVLRPYFLDPATDAPLFGGQGFFLQAISQGTNLSKARAAEPSAMINGDFFVIWPVTAPTVIDDEAPVGTLFRVAIVPVGFTPDLPLHVLAHPVDAVAEALEYLGLTIDAASRDAVKEELGLDRLFVGRLTDPAMKTQEFVDILGQSYGFTTTVLGDGSRGFVTTRGLWNTITTTIDDSIVVSPGGAPSFDIPSDSRRDSLQVEHVVPLAWSPGLAPRTYDDIVPFGLPPFAPEDRRAEKVLLPGIAGVALREVEPSDTNPVHLGELSGPDGGYLYVARHAHGVAHFTLPIREGSVAETIGQLVYVDVDHLPNAQPDTTPNSQRGGSQIARVVGRRSQGIREELTLALEGPGDAVTIAGNFEITLTALTTGNKDSYVDVEITDGFVELVALSAAFLDEFAVRFFVALTPDATPPTATDRGVEIDSKDNFTITTQRLAMPIAVPGRVWWVRAEATLSRYRPLSTAWTSLAGSMPGLSHGTISTLVIGTITATSIAVSWTSTNDVDPIGAHIRVNGQTTWTQVTLLPPGTTQWIFLGLTPATDYQIVILLFRFAPLVSLATLIGSATTSGGTPLQLQTPLQPRVFSGINILSIEPLSYQIENGKVGMIVRPAPQIDHTIRFEMTPETSIGSATPSGWPSDALPDALSLAFTMPSTAVWPTGDVLIQFGGVIDGRRRYFRARAEQAPYTPSSWTTVLSVLPQFGVPEPPTGPLGGFVYDGGLPGSTTYTDTLDGGTPSTVFIETVDGGGP